ncbi:MAG: porin family protein [Desulfuromonadales bacterium]|nr:porin family protein [Desulfuromonadales bacterium]
MKQNGRLFLVFFFLFALISPLWAQNPGPYLGIYVGGQFLAPAESSDSLGSFNLEYKAAPSGSVVLGWELEPGSDIGEGRVELEYTRRSNRLDQAEFSDGKVAADGDLTADSLLFNAFGVYRSNSVWTPYLGAGLGIARITAADLSVTGQSLSDDDALVFAYQFGLGTDIALTESLIIDLGYRLFSTSKAKLKEANGEEFKLEYLSHSAMLGLRLSF